MATRRRRLGGIPELPSVESLLDERGQRADAEALAQAQHMQELITFVRDNREEIAAALRMMGDHSSAHAVVSAANGCGPAGDLFEQAAVHWYQMAVRLSKLSASIR